MRKILTVLFAMSYATLAQTTIDLGRQARNVDFSNSSFTKSFKTGTTLPSNCSQGETYLKLDAPAGQNIYACTSANTWAPQGVPPTTAPASFEWIRTNATQAQLSQGSFRFGNSVTNITMTGSLTLQGSTTGTIWIYAAAGGTIVAAHNLGAGNLAVSGTGFTVDALGTGFPALSLPFYRCAVTSGVLPVSCTDLRASLSTNSVTAGPSGAVNVDCSPGNTCIVDVVSAAIPMTTSANTFSGLNSFSHLKLPVGTAPDPLQCATSGDAGKIWVQTDAASGRQLYICEGVAGWRQQGASVSSPASFEWTRTTSTQAQVSQGSFRFGTSVTNITMAGLLSLNGSSTGTVWIYGAASGSIVVAHNLGAGNLTLSGTGFAVDDLGAGFPTAALPLYQCVVTSGVFPVSCTDLRASFSANAVSAGPSGAINVDCSPGNTCLVDVVPAAIPMTTSANAFTGLNTFSHMKLPAGSTPDPLQCAVSSDAGKVWAKTDAPSGRQLYVCEGTAGWRLQGAPVNISTQSNVGYTSSLPIGMPLSSQTTVASANQIRLVLTAVPNQVQVARLAAWIATLSAGGTARVGIYKTDGTRVAQTSALDTGSAVVRDSAITPIVLDPGYYYFAWSVDNTTAKLAGSGTGTMTGLFNHVTSSPGQATCSQSMNASGFPATCTIVPWPDTDGFPVIAVAGFAQ